MMCKISININILRETIEKQWRILLFLTTSLIINPLQTPEKQWKIIFVSR